MVQEGADLLTDAIREKNAEMEEEYLKLIEESGTEVIYLDEAERDRFREACSGVYEEMRSYVNNPEVIDMALSVAEEYGQ